MMVFWVSVDTVRLIARFTAQQYPWSLLISLGNLLLPSKFNSHFQVAPDEHLMLTISLSHTLRFGHGSSLHVETKVYRRENDAVEEEGANEREI